MPETTSLDALEQKPHAEVFENHSPRTIRLKLDEDQRIPAHTHPGMNIVLHVLAGNIELTLDEETYDLHSNELIQFSGEHEVSPYATVESTAVLVFAPATRE